MYASNLAVAVFFIWSWHLPIQTSLSQVVEGGFYEVICMLPLFFLGVPFSHGFRFTVTVLGKYTLPEAHRLFLFKKLSFIKTRRSFTFVPVCLNGGLLFLWIHIPKQHPTTSELIWISPDQLLVSTVQYRTLVATVRKGCGHLLKKMLALLAELKYSPKLEQP